MNRILRNVCCWLLLSSLWLVPMIGSASEEFGALLRQANEIRSSRPDMFRGLLAGLNRERAAATPEQRGQLDYLNAYAEAYAGHYSKAAEMARQIALHSKDVELQFRAGALMVNSFVATRDFTDGLRQLNKTMPLIGMVKNQELRQQGLFVAGMIYGQIGQNKLAIDYANQILAGPAPARTRCFAGQLKLDALQKLRQLPVDDALVNGVIEQCEEADETVLTNTVRGILARKLESQGKRAEAVVMLQSRLSEMEATRFPRLLGETHALLAEYLLAEGNLAGAEAHAKAAIAQKESLANSLPLASAYNVLYEIADRRNDPVKALAYYRAYAEVDRGYLNEVKTRELAYQIVRSESQEKNQQIELLNRQNNLLQLQQQVDQQSAQNSRLYMLLFALLAATVGYWAYQTKRMQMSVKRMAETDALTGICNRHHYTSQAEKTLARCKAAGEPVSLLMFDLDYFKSINDNYGHVTGDWVLRRVAVVCAELCRGIDHLGRIGGEEFAILLHGCDLKAATRVAEDCRVRLSRIDPLPSGYTFPISASFGVSSSTTSGYDLDKLLSHADQMLYRAKREGRNRVRAYVPDTSAELAGTHFGKGNPQTAETTGASPAESLRA